MDSSDHMRDHKCDHDDERYSEQPKNDWHLLPPMIFTINDSKTARFREYSRSYAERVLPVVAGLAGRHPERTSVDT